MIFGDAQSDCSPLEGFEADPSSFPVGPWGTLGNSFGYHNGPTMQNVTDCWNPLQVGDALTWSGTSENYLEELLWSSIYTCGGAATIEFEPAIFLAGDEAPEVIEVVNDAAGITQSQGIHIATPGPGLSASDRALGLSYQVTPTGTGFDYDFELTLTNNDGSWAPGQGYGWLIFGDAESACSPLRTFEIDESSLPVGPWDSVGQSLGYHNGPTFQNVLDCWTPISIGESLVWSGSDDADVDNMLFSSIATCGGAPNIEFAAATLYRRKGFLGVA